ncbi:hypothetical protein [Nocardia goodfellowii]|nr:hypothetical protein [Nocardia goodfellowii]
MTAWIATNAITSEAGEFGARILLLLLFVGLGGFGAFGWLAVALFRRDLRRAYSIATAPKPPWRVRRAQARALRRLAADLAQMETAGLVTSSVEKP